jgi:hypothetical protein
MDANLVTVLCQVNGSCDSSYAGADYDGRFSFGDIIFLK